MNFAVLEYTSKSGTVWRHTDERPNYLADPQREIDPTSFGCYVSALKGEHIPLLGLAVGPVNKMSAPEKLYRKTIKRLTGRWPTYSLAYLQQFDVLLVVHQLSDTHELVAALQRVRKLSSRPFIIGVPTQPYGILKDATNANLAASQQLQEFMNLCDVFISIVEDTTSWYAKQTTTPVEYLPQPYPATYASQYFLPRQHKETTIFVAGVTQRDNIKKGQLVARSLQQKFPTYRIALPKVPDLDYDYSNLAGAQYDILPFEQWQEHLKTLAKTTLVINTDYTFTRGRVQTDCAAVGTVSLGSNSDAQKDLFPEQFSLSQTPVEKLVAMGERLLTDDAYYKQVTTTAQQKLQHYDYPQSAQRLHDLVQRHHSSHH